MEQLEQLAEIKAYMHVIMIELAQLKAAAIPEMPQEQIIEVMMKNVEENKNRFLNEIIRGE